MYCNTRFSSHLLYHDTAFVWQIGFQEVDPYDEALYELSPCPDQESINLSPSRLQHLIPPMDLNVTSMVRRGISISLYIYYSAITS